MPALLTECVHRGHDALSKTISTLASAAGGLLAPHHEAAQLAFGVVEASVEIALLSAS